MEVITVRGLQKRYGGTVAVDDVSFEVAEGEIFGVIGPNGSGKTTTVECLQGLRTPDRGEIRVLGLDPTKDGGRLRHRTGSQLQESDLPERLKVWEALDLFASMSPRGVDWRHLVEQWGLAEKRNAAFGTLSGGQRQRLFVALALVNDPEVVFLDEMTTGLDPTARRETWDLIRSVRDRGATVVLVTHFMDEAEQLCDRLAVYRRGRVVAVDTPASLVARYAGPTTVLFSVAGGTPLEWLGSVPGVQSVTVEGGVVTVRGEGALLAHTAAALVAHWLAPEDLRVQRGSLEDVFLALTHDQPRAAAV